MHTSDAEAQPGDLLLARTVLPSRAQIAQAELGSPGEFGAEVAFVRGMVAVGSPAAQDDAGLGRGLVSIHLTEGRVGAQAVLSPSGLSDRARFGSALASSGDLLAVGAPRADAAGARSGLVRIYRVGAPDGAASTSGAASRVPVSLVAELVPVGSADGSEFGHALAFSPCGTRLAVSAPYARGDAGVPLSGEVTVFSCGNGAWVREFKVEAPSPRVAATLGVDVAWAGDVLVVGAPGDGALAPGSGRIYGFSRDGAFLWERAAPGAPSTAAGSRYGEALAALSPTLLAVGAFGKGLVEIVQLDPNAPPVPVQVLRPDGGALAAFGQVLASSGGVLAVGAPRTDTLAIYRLTPDGRVGLAQSLVAPADLGPGEFGIAAALVARADGSIVVAAGEPLGSAACASGVRCAAGAAYLYRGTIGARSASRSW